MKRSTILLLLVWATTSCDKEDESCNGPGLLYNTNWLLVDKGTDADNDGVIETSQFTSIPDCIRDDYYIFQCKETLLKLDNANQCVGRDPEAEIHWRFVRDSMFFIRDEGYRVIKLLTPTQLQVRSATYNAAIPPGGSILYYFERR